MGEIEQWMKEHTDWIPLGHWTQTFTRQQDEKIATLTAALDAALALGERTATACEELIRQKDALTAERDEWRKGAGVCEARMYELADEWERAVHEALTQTERNRTLTRDLAAAREVLARLCEHHDTEDCSREHCPISEDACAALAPKDDLAPLMWAADDYVTVARMTTTELSATSEVCKRTRLAVKWKLEQYGAWQRALALYQQHPSDVRLRALQEARDAYFAD